MFVLTRAQVKLTKQKEKEGSNTGSSTTQTRRKKMKKLRQRRVENNLKDSDSDLSMKNLLKSRKDETKPPKVTTKLQEIEIATTKEKEPSNSNEGGSVIVDKVNETAEKMLRAWESRITSDTPFLPKLLEYPDPLQEKIDLVRNHQLIQDTQTMFEGPHPHINRQHENIPPSLEPIQEVIESEENKSKGREGEFLEEIEPEPRLEQEPDIPTLDDKMAKELWQDVQNHKEKEGGSDASQ